jgi:hypothetical protein
MRGIPAGCHPERSEAESKDPAELPIGFIKGFDSLTSRSLSLWPSRLCRVPRRSIVDSARNDMEGRSALSIGRFTRML